MARKPISKRVRFSVFARDNFTCVYCGRQPPTITLEVEHVIPVAQGGGNEETNLRASCHDCNAGKAAKTILQIIPTDADRLRQAQELAEKRQQINELAAAATAIDELRHAMTDRICGALCVDSCQRASTSYLLNLSEEFGFERVMEWLETAAQRTNCREQKTMMYIGGIARNVREGR